MGTFPAGRASRRGDGLTVGLPRGAAAAQAHDDGRVGQPALHAVLADAVQDVGGEVDVQVAEEHDAVPVLRGGTDTSGGSGGRESRRGQGRVLPAHLHRVHASLQPGRALEVPRAPQVLVPGEGTGRSVLVTERDTAKGTGDLLGKGSGAYSSCQGGFCIPGSSV